MRQKPRSFYRTFRIPRKNRPGRRIDAPRVALKIIQRWIHDNILSQMPTHPASTAYTREGGIFVNGIPHAGAANLLQMDVNDFFPSIRPDTVQGLFSSLGFAPTIAEQLSSLTTYREGLPQGAPTSPLLANTAMYSTDLSLARLADAWDARYTRYADDITFSSSTYRFGQPEVEAIQGVLRQAGLQANDRKTRLIGGGFRHVVAGISVTRSPMAPRDKRRVWRALFNHAAFDPSAYVDHLDQLNGIVGFVSQYSPELAERYRETAKLVGRSRTAL